MNLQQIHEARERISQRIHPTPLVYSVFLSKWVGKRVWLKLETQNATGSFKIRPALNGILSHLEEAKTRGVLASSSGNFAQAVASVARDYKVSAQIVMTSTTSPLKVQKTQDLGAEIVRTGPTFQERWETTFRLQKETGRVLLHPYDSEETIAGDGTIGLELLDQLESSFSVLVPVSGGGLLAGISLAVSESRPGCEVVAVQPAHNGSLQKALEAGKPIPVSIRPSCADALVAAQPGERCFEIFKNRVSQTVLVEEAEILRAVELLRTEQKLVVEPGGAVTVAALISSRVSLGGLPSKDIVCVLSGGNSA